MAQKTIFTEFFRIGPFPSLDAPYASKPGDTPKYSVKAMFPQNGITKPTGQPTSGVANIIEALNAVCLEEFKADYATLLANHTAYGIQYPPKFIDGNQDWQKDENGNPKIGQARPESAGMWCISFKSADPVDLVAPNGRENVTAAQMCAGYWARAEISVDAYVNKQKQRVLAVKLQNLQLCFEDEKLASGGNQKQAGTAAFANMAVPNTNVQPAFNGVPTPGAMVPGAMVPGAAPAAPAAVPGAMVPGMVSPVPGMPPSVPGMAPTVGIHAAAPAAVPGAAPGYAVPGAAPAAVPGAMVPGYAVPGAAPGYAAPGAVPGAMVPGMQAAPAAAPMIAPVTMVPGVAPGAVPAGVPGVPGAMVTPPPAAIAAAPAVNVHDRVIMKPGEHPLANYLQHGWSHEQLVQHGKADWNYNYVG